MNATARIKSLEVNLNGYDGTAFLCTENERSAEKVNKDIVEEDGENSHAKFMEELGSVYTDVSKNKQTYSAMAREAVIGLMIQGVENENNAKNGYDFEEEDVFGIVDFILEQISNTARKLTGKDKGCRYSPIVMQIAYAMWSRSNAGYCELRAITPQCLPSDRQLKNIKQRNKVKDGEDIKVYLM